MPHNDPDGVVPQQYPPDELVGVDYYEPTGRGFERELATRLPRLIAQPALTRALGSGRGDKMPSFHIDLHGGRGRTEVSFLNGAVARHGAQVGVPTPVNALLTTTLEALSAGELPVDSYRHNPDALLAALR